MLVLIKSISVKKMFLNKTLCLKLNSNVCQRKLNNNNNNNKKAKKGKKKKKKREKDVCCMPICLYCK